MKMSNKVITLALVLMTLLVATIGTSWSETSSGNENFKVESIDYPPIEEIGSEFWNEIRELKANGTTENVSLIIWLSENQTIMNMTMEDLKIYSASLFAEKHNAIVYCVCRALPVIMATVCIDKVESIATYDFVQHVGNGSERVYLTLNVSKEVVRAGGYFEGVAGYNGSGVNITIIDSGINDVHPDLDDLDDDPNTNDPKVIQEISFVDWNNDNISDVGPMDNLGHGTHVAGIAAGTGETSGYQYVGVAPGAWLWNYKVFEIDHWEWSPHWQRQVPVERGDIDDIVHAIDHAIAEGANIINLSFGVEIGGNGTNDVSMAADHAVANGTVVVVAAGNWGELGNQTITAPGDAFDVITVGAIDDDNTQNINDDDVAVFSSRGPTGDDRTKPDVMAPGVNIIAPMDQGSAIWQTWPEWRAGNFYAELSGTSMATPHVAGVAALILQAHPTWYPWFPENVKHVIMSTARLNDNLTSLTENDRGKGIVDAERAVTWDLESTLGLGNPGFEQRLKSVYEPAYWHWSDVQNDWRELRGDCAPPEGDGEVDIFDATFISGHFGSTPGDPNWDPNADLNGDDVVDILDAMIVSNDFGKVAKRSDGSYSWYVNNGGEYNMSQWLCDYDINDMNEATIIYINFTYRFWPQGTENYVTAKILLVHSDGQEEWLYGGEFHPIEARWHSICFYGGFGNPEHNIVAVKVIICGWQNLKGWIDEASITW